jgi:uncharacterized protein YndB with AHSA1/START domain
MTNDITISRIIDAPRERVFDAWTNPATLDQWWGPQGFTTTTERIDMRPGGAWQFVMRGPDGTEYPNYIIFDEIVRPERITYSHGETEGRPDDFHTTVTFEDDGGRTRLTLRSVFKTAAMRQEAEGYGAEQGGHSTLDSLSEFVADDPRPMIITRIFDAPVEKVWRAWTDPEMVTQWWGPEHFTAPVARVDFRLGGKYLFAMRDPDGNDYWSTGRYVEIVPLERIVYTDSFADADGNIIPPTQYGMSPAFPEELVMTLSFEDLGGRTRMTMTSSGMPRDDDFEMARSGMSTMMDKLAKVVASFE